MGLCQILSSWGVHSVARCGSGTAERLLQSQVSLHGKNMLALEQSVLVIVKIML